MSVNFHRAVIPRLKGRDKGKSWKTSLKETEEQKGVLQKPQDQK